MDEGRDDGLDSAILNHASRLPAGPRARQAGPERDGEAFSPRVADQQADDRTHIDGVIALAIAVRTRRGQA